MYVFEHVFDEDFSSLYPSIIMAFNLDKNTQVGKFFLIDQHIKDKLIDEYGYDGLFIISKNEEASQGGDDDDDSDDDKNIKAEVTNDVAMTLVDSLMSHDWNMIGAKYFDLPTTSEIVEGLLASC